ncbi:hypothetical protein sphantq_02961 [Sphingobium sp. AntQ-1]|uniref:hypothetical protein n=1 Tax=Sphingobium sp. AntQ-1 TaxID=2930091 RepID=UPI00234E5A6F|nr:hypothetical protein [Sphingobium sp. AntQ-1]WCP14515.1 hypothetical protein sphantq_02961 [Sphingobium sp. AntQ-1]
MLHRTVVGEKRPLSKPRLHALLMEGWSRAIVKLGKGAFADKIGVSVPALDKQLTGSMPGFDVIDAALDVCPTVLDEYLREKGLRLVDQEAVCDTDDASLLIARLLVKLQEAEHPDSPGGRSVTHSELLGMEALIRQLHGASGNWIGQIEALRRPRSVA